MFSLKHNSLWHRFEADSLDGKLETCFWFPKVIRDQSKLSRLVIYSSRLPGKRVYLDAKFVQEQDCFEFVLKSCSKMDKYEYKACLGIIPDDQDKYLSKLNVKGETGGEPFYLPRQICLSDQNLVILDDPGWKTTLWHFQDDHDHESLYKVNLTLALKPLTNTDWLQVSKQMYLERKNHFKDDHQDVDNLFKFKGKVSRLKNLWEHYQEKGDGVDEHETRTYEKIQVTCKRNKDGLEVPVKNTSLAKVWIGHQGQEHQMTFEAKEQLPLVQGMELIGSLSCCQKSTSLRDPWRQESLDIGQVDIVKTSGDLLQAQDVLEMSSSVILKDYLVNLNLK